MKRQVVRCPHCLQHVGFATTPPGSLERLKMLRDHAQDHPWQHPTITAQATP